MQETRLTQPSPPVVFVSGEGPTRSGALGAVREGNSCVCLCESKTGLSIGAVVPMAALERD